MVSHAGNGIAATADRAVVAPVAGKTPEDRMLGMAIGFTLVTVLVIRPCRIGRMTAAAMNVRLYRIPFDPGS